ncbi:hypothetical protein [Rhodonellum sp.]|uniref:hypothetical protein n=1 Tax=Rhodonellum sp. TaxID=2231180 RepID=UPI002725950B|nr:hypothetical protein [Rhodonellum sp.]MDO9553366.1 hypothetical protein [Rhodonellum sp.]
MKKLLLLWMGIFFAVVANAQVNPNNHYVKPHTKSNGVFVEGHHKTNPNSTIRDNYSTYPNVNPYTGKTGTVNPNSGYKAPTYSAPAYKAPVYKAPVYKAPVYKAPNYRKP